MADLKLKHEIEHPDNSKYYYLNVSLEDDTGDQITTATTIRTWDKIPDDALIEFLVNAVQDGCRMYAEYMHKVADAMPDVTRGAK